VTGEGLREFPLDMVGHAEVIDGQQHVGMLRTQGALPQRHPALVEGLGRGVLALFDVAVRQFVQAAGGVPIIGAECFFVD